MAKILVVDDEPVIRDLVRELLVGQGHAVETASDGAEGFELLKNNSYDLMVIDRHMPRLSGIDVLDAIRTVPGSRPRRILMLTSASVVREVDEAYAAGADGYILKPFDAEKLLAEVQTALAA